MNDNLVRLDNVEKVFKTRAGPFTALRGVDLEIQGGEFVAIVGPSGSGKSTLINMMTGIDRPTSGEVHVAGERLTGMSENRVAKWRGRNVGVVFQFFQLLPTLTVLENVMMPMHYVRTYKASGASAPWRCWSSSRCQRPPTTTPARSRALVNGPKLIVGDEPTGNLDTISAGLVFELFEELVRQGKTIVMVTHDRELAGRIPRVEEVRDGHIVRALEVDARLVTDR